MNENAKSKQLLIDTINDMLELWRVEGKLYDLLKIDSFETPMSEIAYKNFNRILDLTLKEESSKDLVKDFVYTVWKEYNKKNPLVIYEWRGKKKKKIRITNSEELVDWICKQEITEEEK